MQRWWQHFNESNAGGHKDRVRSGSAIDSNHLHRLQFHANYIIEMLSKRSRLLN